jgi:hypothetical protein
VANAGGLGIVSAVGLNFNSLYFDRHTRKGNLYGDCYNFAFLILHF